MTLVVARFESLFYEGKVGLDVPDRKTFLQQRKRQLEIIRPFSEGFMDFGDLDVIRPWIYQDDIGVF
jgi:hypothetical protein